MSNNYTLDVHEAAKVLGYHPQTVRQLARSGKLPAIRRVQAWRFDREELVKWLDSQRNSYPHAKQNDGLEDLLG